jgi:hypothetical protein
MASTPLLGLSLPADGTVNWGTLVNNAVTSLIDGAVAGTTPISSPSDITLSTTTEAANQARQAILLFTGSRGATQVITAPAQSKTYVVINATTGNQAIQIIANNPGPTTGVLVPAGETAIVAWNGTDFVKAYADYVTAASAQTLSNKEIVKRVVIAADATSITPNAVTTDILVQANTQAIGTLTINAPTGTPFNGQSLVIRISSAAVQTFAWNAIYQSSTDLPLPTATSGATKTDYLGFIYNSTAVKWQILAKNFGF